ncbi:hypothetical protein DLM86_27225 [Paenibacillus flagellatus]|uniref:Uncharacterized protein n=1 Tax=Paenibacillus flagellatus TaxID=2211139 RepID=A0A2V5JWB6_9BACL|nr:hypothetical protein DLM86_27225 [Paenibacillus flagellatus]
MLQQLVGQADRLSERLHEAGYVLRSKGTLPERKLAEDILELHGLFSRLYQEMQAAWKEVGAPLTEAPQTIGDLRELHDKLERERSLRQLAVWPLRAARLQSSLASDEAAVAAVREQANELYARARSGQSFAEEDVAPFIALVRLLTEGDSLSDEEWTDYDGLVRQRLGPSISLALTRNRLSLADAGEEAEASSPAASAESARDPAPAETPQAKPDETAAADPAEAGQAEAEAAATTAPEAAPAEGAAKASPQPRKLAEAVADVRPKPADPLAALPKLSWDNDALGARRLDMDRLLNAPAEPAAGAAKPIKSVSLARKKKGAPVASADAAAAAEPAESPATDDAAARAASADAAPEAPEASVAAVADASEAPEPAEAPEAVADVTDIAEAIAEAEAPEAIAAEEPPAAPEPPAPAAVRPAEPAPAAAEGGWTGGTIGELASVALARLTAGAVPDMAELLWRLLAEDRLNAAYRIAEAMEKGGAGAPVPSRLIRAIMLSQHVRHNSGYIMHLLKEDIEHVLADSALPNGKEWAGYLFAAAAYRTTILAPSTNGSQLLGKLGFTGKLYELNKEIREFGQNFIPLDPHLLRTIRSEASWQADLNDLRTRVESDMVRLSNIRILFQAASKVWKRWMEKGGLVHSMLDPIRRNDTESIPFLKEQLELYSDPSEVQRMVDYTDRTELGRYTGSTITARALTQIQTHFGEALNLVREWIELIDTQPGHLNQFNQRQAKALQTGLLSRRDAVHGELDALADEDKPLPVRASIAVLRRALDNVYSLFDPNTPLTNREPDPNYILNGQFLAIPDIPLQPNWEPYYPDRFPVAPLLRSMTEPPKDIVESFHSRLELQDLEGAQLILKLLGQQPDAGVSTDLLDDLQSRFDRRGKDCQDSLHLNIRDCIKRVEQDFTLNLLNETDRSNHLAELETMTRQVKETLYFPEPIERLDRLRAELGRVREKAAEQAWGRFQEAGVDESHPDYDKIRKVLNDGDLHTANDYLLRLQSNEPIDLDEQTREPMREYFDPKFFADIMDYLERANVRKIVQELKKRDAKPNQTLGPLSIGRVPGAQKDQAAEMVEAWYAAKKTQTGLLADEKHLRTILNGVGLQVRTVTKHSTVRKGRPYQTIQTEIVSERTRCPIPLYGSEANGQYRIYSFWERLTEEDIMHEIGETSRSEPPVIVLYFGRLTAQKRRDLARLSRERRRTFVILDETLMFFLCGERGSRLPVFFKCALPFTFTEPYTITGSILRAEMFYGRQYELDSILEGKSGLVYGGRQLGKTALLRAAERRFHNPEEGKYAVLIDLKAEGIGSDKAPDDIWGLIARELNRIGVQEIKAGPSTADKLCEQILTWIRQDRSRRLLLLLDESDRFLDIDASEYGRASEDSNRGKEGFIRCSKLKGLMERSDKRVHIVFAGLHNVQRSYKNQNDPLAHLGEPICVGPLFAKEEWREAWALVERPFAAMGYFFQSRDLITRILSQTNYYPSLIQLYCHQLLRHMTEHRALASFSKNTPPYEITSKHVDEVYQDRELQKAIRHRFKLTLQLDARYELIANIVAYESLTDESAAKHGMSTKDIKEKALEYWHQGFKSLDSFWVLLDEMVDLGVLRRVREGYFALRNPNLLSLMGSEEEIADELLRERVVQGEYNASHFRAAYYYNGQGENLSVRSPLTAEQDSELRRLPSNNRVSVIFGNRAAGIGDVAKFLEMSYGKHLLALNGVLEMPAFIRGVKEFVDKKAGQDIHVVVGVDCAWTPEWVHEAGRLLGSAKMDRVRISFLSDPEQTLALVKSNDAIVDEFTEAGVVMLHLQPWHMNTLAQWLNDCDLEKSGPVQAEISSVTGNWPSILMRLYDKARANPHQLRIQLQKLKADMLDRKNAADMLDEMGVNRADCQALLTALSLAESTATDLAAFCDMPEKLVRSVLRWAELIGIVRYLGKDGWTIDPTVGGLLQAVEGETA